MSDLLKLMALDAEDLSVISAHAQDAVLKVGHIDFSAKAERLLLPLNRFVWESPGARRWIFKSYERRQSVLHIDRVLSVQTKGIDRNAPESVLSLLNVAYVEPLEGDETAPSLVFTFGGGAQMTAVIEDIEARLTDLGSAWATRARPRHGI